MKVKEIVKMKNIIQHPIALPIFLCHPDFVNGRPIFLDILFFIPDIPIALFQKNEIPNFFPIILNHLTIHVF